MLRKYKYLIKNTGILTISNFSSKILVFLLVPLYTNVLSTEEYGTYDLMISTVSLVYPILTVNIVDAVMRFCMDSNYRKDSIAVIGLRFVTVSCVLFAALLIPIRYIPFFAPIRDYSLYILLYYIAYVYNQYFIQLAKGLEKIGLMAISGLCGTVIVLVGNIVFLLVFKLGLNGFFIANILAQAIPALILAVGLSFRKVLGKAVYSKEIRKDMVLYCAPLIFTTIGWWINSTSDKYVVTFICGIAANGVFSISYKIPSIVNTVFGMFGQAWQISAIKEYDEGEAGKFYGDTLVTINVLMTMGCGLLVLLSKPLASLLYAKDFYQAWQYAPYLLCSSVLNAASGMLGPILSAKKDSRSMAISAIIGAIVNVILNILLVFLMGVQGATIATIVSALVIYLIRKKAVGEDITIRFYRSMIFSWVFLAVEATLEVYSDLWFVEILILSAMLVLNWKIIKKVMETCFRSIVVRKRG